MPRASPTFRGVFVIGGFFHVPSNAAGLGLPIGERASVGSIAAERHSMESGRDR
jgi:hypothetical protein